MLQTPSDTAPESFFSKEAQIAEERVVVARLAAVDSVALSDYDAFNTYNIVVDDQRIYVSDSRQGKFLAIAKGDHESYRFIGHGLGEGPGELTSFSGFDVSDQHIVVANKPYRIARYTVSGSFVGETSTDQRVTRLKATEDDGVLIFSAMSDDHLFTLMDVDGAVIRKIGKVTDALETTEPSRMLRYTGFVEYDKGYIYYAGYSESLIKKYARDGTLLFSVSTIDNHPGELNYVETVGETQAIIGYADTALYASLDIVVYGSYCLVQPASDDDGVTLRYLDVYDADTGRYIESYSVSKPPLGYTVDDDHLYMLQSDTHPETGERGIYVKVYDNVLRYRQVG